MTQAAKAQEPSMEEILASIRRIIADDDAGKPAKAPEAAAAPKPPAAAVPSGRPAPPAASPKSATLPPVPAKPAAPAPAAANSQDEIDAMLAELESPPKATAKPVASQPAAPSADVLDLTEAMTAP